MDPHDDPYDVLKVDEDADVEEIKEAYRRRAEETHPDAEGGSEEEYSRVREAYERLMEMRTPTADAERRHEPGMQQEKHTLVDELRLGWEMYRTPDWEFYIVREAREPEDAADDETGSTDPRMKEAVGEVEEAPAEPPEPEEGVEDGGDGETNVEYVDGQGSAVPEPYYFENSDEARKAFARHLKHRKIERESEDEEAIEAEDRGWGSSILGRKLGRRWTLTHQEREPLGERTRWAVYSEDDDSYIDEEGAEVEEAEWFSTEKEAVDAHERYVGERSTPASALGSAAFTLAYLVFLLPFHLVLGVVSVVERLTGRGQGAEDRYVSEASVVLLLAALSYLVSPWIALYLVLQLAAVAVYWASPYDAEGLGLVPRWRRRNR